MWLGKRPEPNKLLAVRYTSPIPRLLLSADPKHLAEAGDSVLLGMRVLSILALAEPIRLRIEKFDDSS